MQLQTQQVEHLLSIIKSYIQLLVRHTLVTLLFVIHTHTHTQLILAYSCCVRKMKLE